MKKQGLILLVLLVLYRQGYSQHPDAASTAFPFLNLGYDARSVAMAGAAAGVPNGLYGILSNPASIAFSESVQIFFGYRPVIMDIWGAPVAISRQFGSAGVFAASLVTMNGGDVDEVDIGVDGNPVSTGATWRSSSVAGGVSWAQEVWKDLAIGFSAKGVYHFIGSQSEHYSVDGLAMDAGVQYRHLHGRAIYGLVFQNIGFMRTSYIEDGETYPFPMKVEAGISYVPRYLQNVRMALDVNARKGDYINFEPGIEIGIYKNVLQLRAGYAFSDKDLGQLGNMLSGNQDENYIKSNLATFCCGAGVNTEIEQVKLRIDLGIEFRSGLNTPAPAFSVLAGF
jgi:hypothetical protein